MPQTVLERTRSILLRSFFLPLFKGYTSPVFLPHHTYTQNVTEYVESIWKIRTSIHESSRIQIHLNKITATAAGSSWQHCLDVRLTSFALSGVHVHVRPLPPRPPLCCCKHASHPWDDHLFHFKKHTMLISSDWTSSGYLLLPLPRREESNSQTSCLTVNWAFSTPARPPRTGQTRRCGAQSFRSKRASMTETKKSMAVWRLKLGSRYWKKKNKTKKRTKNKTKKKKKTKKTKKK